MRNNTKLAAIIIGGIAVLGMSAQTVLAASFTQAQISTHNTSTNCWEVINGKVYDLTAFISTHSGGQSVIIAQCGKDATTVFANGPHSATTINALSGFMLGDLAVATPSTGTPASTTHATSTNATSTPKHIRHHRENEDEVERAHSRNSSFIREDDDAERSHERSKSSARLTRVSHDENDDD